jgi:hypothetical protein
MDMLNGRQIIQEEESYFAINETHQARWGGAVPVAELHLLLLLLLLLLLRCGGDEREERGERREERAEHGDNGPQGLP